MTTNQLKMIYSVDDGYREAFEIYKKVIKEKYPSMDIY